MGQTNHLDPSVQVYFSLFPVQVDQTNHVDPSVLVDLAVFPVHEVFVVYFDLALLSVHVVSASIRNTLCSLATCYLQFIRNRLHAQEVSFSLLSVRCPTGDQ